MGRTLKDIFNLPGTKLNEVGPFIGGETKPKSARQFSYEDEWFRHAQELHKWREELRPPEPSEAAIALEVFCSTGMAVSSALTWVPCGGCEGRMLVGDDYLCSKCRDATVQ